jgi:hypothetical protein
MKKLLYRSLFCALLAPAYLFTADFGDEVNDSADEMRMENLDNVQDAMDDSGDLKEVDAPKSSEMFNPTQEPEVAKSSVDEDALAVGNAVEPMPKLTEKDLAGDVELNMQTALKLQNLGNTLGGFASKINYPLSDIPLADSKLELSNNFRKVEQLCIRASGLHRKASEMWGLMRQLMIAGFEPSEELHAIATEITKTAVEASEEANKQAVSLLGLKMIFKI